MENWISVLENWIPVLGNWIPVLENWIPVLENWISVLENCFHLDNSKKECFFSTNCLSSFLVKMPLVLAFVKWRL